MPLMSHHSRWPWNEACADSLHPPKHWSSRACWASVCKGLWVLPLLYMVCTWCHRTVLVVIPTCSCEKKKIRWYNMHAAEGTRLVARPPNGSRCDVSTSHAFVIVAGHMKRGNVGQSKSGFWLQTAVSYTVVMTLHIWPWSTKLFPPSTRYFWWAIRSSEICILLERNGRRREFRDWTIIFFLQCDVVKRVKKIIHFLHWWYMVAHIVPQFFSFLARTYRWSTVLIKVYIIYT